MLTFMQLKVCKANRKLTQKQRAQIVDKEVARKFVLQAIEGALAVNRHIPEGLLEEDLDRIFTNQPVHFDDMASRCVGLHVGRNFHRASRSIHLVNCVEKFPQESSGPTRGTPQTG
jgi:hypothetical protein